jgi:biotin carboxylase
LGLPHNPPQAARYSRRKDLSRRALTDAGVPVPGFRVLELDHPLGPQLDGVTLPGVIKPLSLSASRGVIRVDTEADVIAACVRVEKILAKESLADDYAPRHLLLEDFIPGPEVALEGLLHKGELDVLVIFDKPDPLDGPYFEETYYTTPSRHPEPVQQQLIACAQAACNGLGLQEGAVHAELRISADGPVILEVASRTIGGECARLLTFGTGHTLEELVIAHAIEQPLPVVPCAGGAGVLMLPIPGAGILRRIEGINAARAVPGVEEVLVSIRDGYQLVPLPEGGSYLGFIFAHAASADEAETALRTAHAKLNVVIAPLMRMQDER